MKIWTSDTQTPTHRLIKMHCEEHSDYNYLGDLDDEALEIFLKSVDLTMDVAKNIKLIKYYGYLHLFVINKKEN
jgi:hypothetical protein